MFCYSSLKTGTPRVLIPCQTLFLQFLSTFSTNATSWWHTVTCIPLRTTSEFSRLIFLWFSLKPLLIIASKKAKKVVFRSEVLSLKHCSNVSTRKQWGKSKARKLLAVVLSLIEVDSALFYQLLCFLHSQSVKNTVKEQSRFSALSNNRTKTEGLKARFQTTLKPTKPLYH